jgi:hypothetical protein
MKTKIFRKNQCCGRIHDILVRIRIQIRGSTPVTNGSGSRYFIIDLHDAN